MNKLANIFGGIAGIIVGLIGTALLILSWLLSIWLFRHLF